MIIDITPVVAAKSPSGARAVGTDQFTELGQRVGAPLELAESGVQLLDGGHDVRREIANDRSSASTVMGASVCDSD